MAERRSSSAGPPGVKMKNPWGSMRYENQHGMGRPTQAAQIKAELGHLKKALISERLEFLRKRDVTAKAIDGFQQMMLEMYGSPVRSWRLGLDIGARGCLTEGQFVVSCRRVGFRGNLKELWSQLLRNERSGAQEASEADTEEALKKEVLTLIDYDPRSATVLVEFRNRLVNRFGNVLEAFKAVERSGPRGKCHPGIDKFELDDLHEFVGLSNDAHNQPKPTSLLFDALNTSGHVSATITKEDFEWMDQVVTVATEVRLKKDTSKQKAGGPTPGEKESSEKPRQSKHWDADRAFGTDDTLEKEAEKVSPWDAKTLELGAPYVNEQIKLLTEAEQKLLAVLRGSKLTPSGKSWLRRRLVAQYEVILNVLKKVQVSLGKVERTTLMMEDSETFEDGKNIPALGYHDAVENCLRLRYTYQAHLRKMSAALREGDLGMEEDPAGGGVGATASSPRQSPRGGQSPRGRGGKVGSPRSGRLKMIYSPRGEKIAVAGDADGGGASPRSPRSPR